MHGPDRDGAVAADGDHARYQYPPMPLVRWCAARNVASRALAGGHRRAGPPRSRGWPHSRPAGAGQQGRDAPPAPALADAAVPQAGRQRPARQHRPERQHDGELPRVQVGRVGQRARHVRGHVDDHRDEQDLADHVGPGQEAPCHPQHGPGHERHPGQVQQREGHRGWRPLAAWRRTARAAPSRSPRRAWARCAPGRAGRAPGAGRPGPASGQRGQALGRDGRHGQGQLVPAGTQDGPSPPGPAAGPRSTGHAQRAHRHQRDDAHQEDEGSAMSTQVSSSPTRTGPHGRSGHRSMTSQVSRSGTAVPMWPRDSSRTKTPTPS